MGVVKVTRPVPFNFGPNHILGNRMRPIEWTL